MAQLFKVGLSRVQALLALLDCPLVMMPLCSELQSTLGGSAEAHFPLLSPPLKDLLTSECFCLSSSVGSCAMD